MPAKRSAMRKIREVLRLKFEAKLSHEKIAAATGMSKGAVTNAVQRAMGQGLAWPLPAGLDEAGRIPMRAFFGGARTGVGLETEVRAKTSPIRSWGPLVFRAITYGRICR